jgi:hypothetical protein
MTTQPKHKELTLVKRVVWGFGLDSPKRACLLGIGLGVGATLGFMNYDYFQFSGDSDASKAEIAQQMANESPTEKAIHQVGSTLMGGFLGGNLAILGATIVQMVGAESRPDEHDDLQQADNYS